MTLWMVTGLHDERWSMNVTANYARQTYEQKRLIIVENGGASAAGFVGLPGVVVLASERGPAQPLNVALEWLRENAATDDWFAKCDADDYYGPGYLASMSRIDADYCGRASLYIRNTEGRLWYVEGEAGGHLFHGPTLAAPIRSALDFPITPDWGEDAAWCRAMHEAGRTAGTVAPEGFCYQRWPTYRHTWPCTDLELRTSWEAEFIDLGPIDYDIVNGVRPRPRGTSLGVAELTSDNFMPFRQLREVIHAAHL